MYTMWNCPSMKLVSWNLSSFHRQRTIFHWLLGQETINYLTVGRLVYSVWCWHSFVCGGVFVCCIVAPWHFNAIKSVRRPSKWKWTSNFVAPRVLRNPVSVSDNSSHHRWRTKGYISAVIFAQISFSKSQGRMIFPFGANRHLTLKRWLYFDWDIITSFERFLFWGEEPGVSFLFQSEMCTPIVEAIINIMTRTRTPKCEMWWIECDRTEK